MRLQIILLVTLFSFTLSGCGIYSLSGAKIDAKTVQIDYFPNTASLVEPTLSSQFTQALQDLFLSRTNLELVKSGGELQFEGEIIGYTITPTSATSEQTAAMNRLTVTVKVRFYNNLNDKDTFHTFTITGPIYNYRGVF